MTPSLKFDWEEINDEDYLTEIGAAKAKEMIKFVLAIEVKGLHSGLKSYAMDAFILWTKTFP